MDDAGKMAETFTSLCRKSVAVCRKAGQGDDKWRVEWGGYGREGCRRQYDSGRQQSVMVREWRKAHPPLQCKHISATGFTLGKVPTCPQFR